jgi:hypothetical protein
VPNWTLFAAPTLSNLTTRASRQHVLRHASNGPGDTTFSRWLELRLLQPHPAAKVINAASSYIQGMSLQARSESTTIIRGRLPIRLVGLRRSLVSYWALSAQLIAIGAGLALAIPTVTSALLGSVEKSRSGVAAGVLNSAWQTGSVLGVALFGSLIRQNSFLSGLRKLGGSEDPWTTGARDERSTICGRRLA